jgi:hypothetical protein
MCPFVIRVYAFLIKLFIIFGGPSIENFTPSNETDSPGLGNDYEDD